MTRTEMLLQGMFISVEATNYDREQVLQNLDGMPVDKAICAIEAIHHLATAEWYLRMVKP